MVDIGRAGSFVGSAVGGAVGAVGSAVGLGRVGSSSDRKFGQKYEVYKCHGDVSHHNHSHMIGINYIPDIGTGSVVAFDSDGHIQFFAKNLPNRLMQENDKK